MALPNGDRCVCRPHTVSVRNTDVEDVKQRKCVITTCHRIIVRDMRLGILMGKDAVTADSRACLFK